MDGIRMTIDISHVNLVIIIGIALLFIVGLVWFVLWIIKNSKRNKMIDEIGKKLKLSDFDISKKEESEPHETEKSLIVEAKQVIVNGVAVDEGMSKRVSSEVTQACTKADKGVFEDENEQNSEVDVLKEVQKMLATTQYTTRLGDVGIKNFDTAKSGKKYTRDEIENIIK